jgi:hypothetical protein
LSFLQQTNTTTVRKVEGHGIPLYDEPEGDFDLSSEDDDDDDDISDNDDDTDKDDERMGIYQQQQQKKKELSFEELWTLKLKRTQEIMYNVNKKKELS